MPATDSTLTSTPPPALAIPARRATARRAAAAVLGNYWLGRTLKAALTIFLVASLTFFLIRLLPGNPVDAYIAEQVGRHGIPHAEAAARARALFAFDPDTPLPQQYWTYLGALARGDFGTSILSPGTPVLRIIGAYLPWTLFSVGVSLLLSFALGTTLGMFMAYRRGGVLDHVASALGSLFQSVPNYLVAIMIVVFLGVQLEWLPVTQMRGAYSPGMEPAFTLAFLRDALYHAALPIATYVLTTVGAWMLLMRASTLATLNEDYVHVARARGLGERRIRRAYVGRNAVLPLVSDLTISVGFVVGGSVLIERVFQYQGIGFVMLDSITRRDYPVMQGIFLIITFAVVAANLLADLLYGRLDPRVRVRRKE